MIGLLESSSLQRRTQISEPSRLGHCQQVSVNISFLIVFNGITLDRHHESVRGVDCFKQSFLQNFLQNLMHKTSMLLCIGHTAESTPWKRFRCLSRVISLTTMRKLISRCFFLKFLPACVQQNSAKMITCAF